MVVDRGAGPALIDPGQCPVVSSLFNADAAPKGVPIARHPVIEECITFDEYADKIHETDAVCFKTTPLTGRWDFARHLLPQTILQFGSAGSGTIIHGITRSDAYFLFIQTAKRADRIVFDGRIIKWPEIAVVPPASHFTVASTGPTQWISLSVPIELANGITNRRLNKYLITIENNKTLITPRTAEFLQFNNAAKMAHKSLQFAGPKRKINLQAIESSLLGTLDSILSDSVSKARRFNKRTEKVMSKVVECLRRGNQIHISTLAQKAGVSERTLHRAFKKYFHIGPKRYSKIWRLNLVRRAIRQNRSTAASVTSILTEYGVSEFGRFAMEYKALFSESPAETLHKYLVPRSTGSHAN